jgi:hypothetical protein
MRKLLVACALTASCLPLLAQSASTQNDAPKPTISQLRRAGPLKGPVPRLPNGMVNLGDVAWLGGGSGGGNIETQGGLKKGELDALMLPSAKKLMASRDVTQDPHNFCLPDVIPRVAPFPWRFVQNYTHTAPTHMFIVYEAPIHTFRHIFMDGRKHPPDLAPTWLGHSIGWWEGDTLVIDTVGFNDKAWFDGAGHPHTEQLHTIERWTRLDLGRLENKVTIDDPGAYTKPWTVTFTATATAGDEVMEYICQENNQYGAGLKPN